MQERNRTRQSGSPDQTRSRELITLVMRLAAFVATLIPLAALALPWVTLDGTEEAVSGVGAVALLAPPMSEYLYGISTAGDAPHRGADSGGTVGNNHRL